MNVRLVAYRKATSSASSTTAYNLDLQEAPNVSINYAFSEIKEPETRKGSYSQTFKLPFTDNNNQFFQDWYNVNLDTLVFSSRKKFDAVLYVGTVPQFEGALQLKSVYKKAQMYEVVLMSSSASLFSTIGEQRLKDVFRNDNGSYSTDFNHTFGYVTSTNNTLYNSWTGTLTNTGGTSLNDSTAGVSKVVYPMSVTEEKFYYDPNQARYLNMDQSTATTLSNDAGIATAYSYGVNINQFRPALQLKMLFNKICAKAGFSYTSNFIDASNAYFGQLFMTTCNHLEAGAVPTTNTNASPSGLLNVGNNAQWGVLSTQVAATCSTLTQVIFPANAESPITGTCTTPADPDSVWDATNSYFTKKATTMHEVFIAHQLKTINVRGCGSSNVVINYKVIDYNVSTNTPNPDLVYADGFVSLPPQVDPDNSDYWTIDTLVTKVFNIEGMPLSASAQILIEPEAVKRVSSGVTPTYILGNTAINCAKYSIVGIEWIGYSNDIYGATVDIPACIDPDIKQRDFLRDIIQRFNLIILTDPNDDTNLLIEPYDDFIASGELKYWTDKLDTSKEIIVKDTTQLQKKIIHFTDKEDEDLYNKSFKERYPDVNVYGHLRIDEFNNEFATGELKNQPIFSPYINGQVFANDDEQFGTFLPNMAVQYEFSYEEKDGVFENNIKKTNPKLFFYGGLATGVVNSLGDATNYYLHRATASALTAYTFNKYPICSAWNLEYNTTGLSSSSKSLYWNASPPIVGHLSVFNYDNYFGNWFDHTLYGGYWKQYLDNIYSTEARIMECHLNLNEVDIFNFSFKDEIFIKDTYWRVLNISNYQVGVETSTKVTLIKSLDTKENCNGCDYVTAIVGDSNLYADTYYMWCAEDNPGCTPDTTAPNYLGVYTTPECCTCNGGMVMWNFTAQASNNLYPCVANSGSLPLKFKSIFSSSNILNKGDLQTLINNKIGGRNRPFVHGVNTSKYGQPLLPLFGNDIAIKYNTVKRDIPQIQGESHRIVLSGYTEGNTRSFAYVEGDEYGKPFVVPDNINMIIRVKGVATVIGGTSATYTLGTTEGFAYYTAFKVANGTATQLSTAGGQQEFSIREGSNPTTCTLNIAIDSSLVLYFGIDDSQTDTKRIWQLSADIDVNRINNMTLGYGENWALYQNGQRIQFENLDYLIWN